MLVKINKKPIHVVEESDNEGIDWVYCGVSTFGYFSILWILDYSYYIFFYKHLFPIVATIGKFLFFFL